MRKITSLVLSVMLVASLVSGCGSKAPAEPSNSGTATSPASTPVKDDKVKVSEKGVYPVVEAPMTIKIFAPQVSSQVTDYDNNKLTKYMQEKTNIGVEWMFAPEKEAGQKANLLLAANKDLPDVFMGQDLKLSENLTTYAEQKIFIPLNDFIENDSVYFKKALEEQPRVRELLTAPDGNIYSMPLINLSYPNTVSKKMWVNKAWLDKLGLPVPTTTEEFKNMLKAFKEKDPNGNGKNDEIPFMGATTGWQTDVETFLMNSFTQFNNTLPYKVIDGKVIAEYDTEEYRDGLRYLNSLVKEGLLDPASFTQDLSQMKQLFENEDAALIGALPSGGPNAFANMNGTRYHDYVAIAPLKGPNGIQLTAYLPDNIMMHETIITSACENPRAVFKYFDTFYSEDVSKRSRFGEPEVDWKIPAPGSKNLIGGEATHEGILKWGPPQSSHWAQKNPGYAFFTGMEIRSEDPYELQRFLAEASELYRPYLPDADTVMPALIYTAEDTKAMAEINSTLNDFIKDQRIKFITGALDIEKDWDKYIKELDKIGYKTVVEIMQARISK